MTEYKYNVFDHEGKFIGGANNFKEAKDLHKKHLPQDLLDVYGGLDCQSLSYDFSARPAFFHELITDELIKKYNFNVEDLE